MEYPYLDDMDDVKWPPNGWLLAGFSGAVGQASPKNLASSALL